MNRVGIRALQQNVAAIVRRVKAGECIEVTERGRPVAQLVPLGAADTRTRLAEAGKLRLGQGDVLKLGPALRLTARPSPSQQLLKMRRHER